MACPLPQGILFTMAAETAAAAAAAPASEVAGNPHVRSAVVEVCGQRLRVLGRRFGDGWFLCIGDAAAGRQGAVYRVTAAVTGPGVLEFDSATSRGASMGALGDGTAVDVEPLLGKKEHPLNVVLCRRLGVAFAAAEARAGNRGVTAPMLVSLDVPEPASKDARHTYVVGVTAAALHVMGFGAPSAKPSARDVAVRQAVEALDEPF